jgi:hypothetical protein
VSSSTFWFYVMGAVLLVGLPLCVQLMSRRKPEARQQPSVKPKQVATHLPRSESSEQSKLASDGIEFWP